MKTFISTLTTLSLLLTLAACGSKTQPAVNPGVIGVWGINVGESDQEAVKTEDFLRTGKFQFEVNSGLEIVGEGLVLGKMEIRNDKTVAIFIDHNEAVESEVEFINQNKMKLNFETDKKVKSFLIMDRLFGEAVDSFRKKHEELKAKEDAKKEEIKLAEPNQEDVISEENVETEATLTQENKEASLAPEIIQLSGIYKLKIPNEVIQEMLDKDAIAASDFVGARQGQLIGFIRTENTKYKAVALVQNEDGSLSIGGEFPFGEKRKGNVTAAEVGMMETKMIPVISWIYDADSNARDQNLVLENSENGNLVLGGDFEEKHMVTLELVSRDLSQISE